MFQFDSLSKIFIFLIFLGVIPNLFYSFGYLSHIKRKTYYLIHYFAFIFSMMGVVVADNALVFLFFWELMSLSSWQLILTDPKSAETQKAGHFYFIMTHLGFIALLMFFLLISDGQLMLSFGEIKNLSSSFISPTVLFFFMLFGFLSKAGAVPLHVWLPYAHPSAPSPVSALMSGVMLKVAIYGLFRFLFEILYPWPLEWGIIVLLIGSVSSLVGVLYALSEHDIKALLANHSIENIGIILIGFGMGMIFDSLELKALSSFAFMASLFHTFNHMSFKSLLFMGAGSILHQTHTKNMEKYGGLIKAMPITAMTFLFASLSISALPPTNGFLSEWMIFQAMLGTNLLDNMTLKLVIPFAIFALALTGGLAIACFVKAYGITFLGLYRDENQENIEEVNKMMQIGMVLMSLVVASLMIFTPYFMKLFDMVFVSFGFPSIYGEIFPNGIYNMHSLGLNGGVVSPLILLGVLVGLTLLFLYVYKLFKVKERICHTWSCGYSTSPKTQYSATGFAGPIRRFFNWLYLPKEHLHKALIHNHKTKFTSSHYEVHVKLLFEKSLYDNTKVLLNTLSYWVYKLAHFEQTRYIAIIFSLMITILFGYRLVAYSFSFYTFIIQLLTTIIIFKTLVKGEKQ